MKLIMFLIRRNSVTLVCLFMGTKGKIADKIESQWEICSGRDNWGY